MEKQEEEEKNDYEAASKSTADYANYSSPEKHRNPIWRRLFTYLVVFVIVAGLAGGVYWLLKNHKPTKPNRTAQSSAVSGSEISVATKHYDSSNFYLGFDYPSNWNITDNGGGQMTVTSPAIALKDASNQTVTGQVILMMRASTDKLAEFDAGNAIATRDSLKITYAKPTQNQRAQSYISFLRYASDANSGALDGIFVTGDSGYKVSQAVPKIDVSKISPIINIAFTKCGDKNCSGATKPLAIADSSWNDSGFSGPLTTLLKSLSIT